MVQRASDIAVFPSLIWTITYFAPEYKSTYYWRKGYYPWDIGTSSTLCFLHCCRGGVIEYSRLMIFLGTGGKRGLGREKWRSSVIKVALQVRYLYLYHFIEHQRKVSHHTNDHSQNPSKRQLWSKPN